jgi:hypothetical protein
MQVRTFHYFWGKDKIAMRKLKHLLPVLLVCTIVACNLFKKSKSDAEWETDGYVKAHVTDVTLDGCKWMLQLDKDGKRLEPDGLQPEFEKDSFKVWLKYVPEERMSICMAGQTIKVIDIKKRK